MEKFKSKFLEFGKTHVTKILVVLVLMNTAGSLWSPSKDLVGYMFSDNVGGIVEQIINESVRDQIERAKVDYSIKLMKLETKNIRSPKEADRVVAMWYNKGWNAQITALDMILDSEYAKEQLRTEMYTQNVYKALLSNHR